jgi:hypothetical protein
MKFLFVTVHVLFNLILGLLFFYVICLWYVGIVSTAQDLGLVLADTTLDEGTGIGFLLISFIVSLIYLPTLIFVNRAFYKKLNMKKKHYYLTLSVSFLVGLLLISFFQLT